MKTTEGCSDANHDGPGDIRFFEGEGIYQLTEFDMTFDEFESKMQNSDGLHIGEFDFDQVDKQTLKPIVRKKVN